MRTQLGSHQKYNKPSKLKTIITYKLHESNKTTTCYNLFNSHNYALTLHISIHSLQNSGSHV